MSSSRSLVIAGVFLLLTPLAAAAQCTFRSVATSSGTGTSTTITEPAGAADGDIEVAFFYLENTTDTLTHTGFTNIRTDNNSTTFRVNASWLRRSGAPTLSFSWTASVFFQWSLAAYSGCLAAGTPTDGHNGATGNSIAPFTVTGFTTTVNGDVLITSAEFLSGCVPSVPASYTSRQNNATGNVADLQQASAGATGDVSWGSGGCGTDQWAVQLIALQRAAAGGCTAPPTGLMLIGVGNCKGDE